MIINSEVELAREKLAELGYYNVATNHFEFGDADSHALRALYIIANLIRIDVDLERLRDLLRIEEEQDIITDGHWRLPPWKSK